MQTRQCKKVVYMNDLSKSVNACKMGCLVGNSIVNHLMFADDMIILRLYTAGLQQLLRVCLKFGKDFDINYNSNNSNIMIVRAKKTENFISTWVTSLLKPALQIICLKQQLLQTFKMCSPIVQFFLIFFLEPTVLLCKQHRCGGNTGAVAQWDFTFVSLDGTLQVSCLWTLMQLKLTKTRNVCLFWTNDVMRSHWL